MIGRFFAQERRHHLGCGPDCNCDGEKDEVAHEMGHRALGQYACPLTAPASFPPDLNCQRDARGNAVCSDGTYYPPGCPHTPPDQYFSPGIAPDAVTNGVIQAVPPAPRTGADLVSSTPGASSAQPATVSVSIGTVAAGVGVLGGLGVLAWALLRK